MAKFIRKIEMSQSWHFKIKEVRLFIVFINRRTSFKNQGLKLHKELLGNYFPVFYMVNTEFSHVHSSLALQGYVYSHR